MPFLLLAALLLAPPATPAPPAARTVTGRIAEVDPWQRRLALETAAGPVSLRFDRNTSVFLSERLGTPRDLAPGRSARAAVGLDDLALWIELLPASALPAEAPGATAPGP